MGCLLSDSSVSHLETNKNIFLNQDSVRGFHLWWCTTGVFGIRGRPISTHRRVVTTTRHNGRRCPRHPCCPTSSWWNDGRSRRHREMQSRSVCHFPIHTVSSFLRLLSIVEVSSCSTWLNDECIWKCFENVKKKKKTWKCFFWDAFARDPRRYFMSVCVKAKNRFVLVSNVWQHWNICCGVEWNKILRRLDTVLHSTGDEEGRPKDREMAYCRCVFGKCSGLKMKKKESVLFQCCRRLRMP